MAWQAVPEPPSAQSLGPGFAVHPIAAWLAAHGGLRADPGTLLAGLCEKLVAAGVPLMRVSTGVPPLHPQVVGRQFTWRRGQDGVPATPYGHGVERSSDGSVGQGRRSPGLTRRRRAGIGLVAHPALGSVTAVAELGVGQRERAAVETDVAGDVHVDLAAVQLR